MGELTEKSLKLSIPVLTFKAVFFSWICNNYGAKQLLSTSLAPVHHIEAKVSQCLFWPGPYWQTRFLYFIFNNTDGTSNVLHKNDIQYISNLLNIFFVYVLGMHLNLNMLFSKAQITINNAVETVNSPIQSCMLLFGKIAFTKCKMKSTTLGFTSIHRRLLL